MSVFEREYSNVQNSLLPPAIPQPVVLASAQRSGTSWMDIDYRVTDADSATVTTGLLAFKNSGNTLNDAVVMNTFMEGTGANLGVNIPTGVTKRVTWNMAADWTVDFAQVQVEALAKDSRNLLGFHWITVPASGPDPAFQASFAPVTDAKLLDLWYWLLAVHQPGLSFSNGTITGTTGVYAGQRLASATATTTAGRLYLYEQMGVRPISGAELIQAQGGTYGFSSVDTYSVVKAMSAVGSYVKINGYLPGVSSYPSSLGATKVASNCNSDITLFLRADGTLWRLDNPPGYPVQIATGVAQMAQGNAHSLFIKTDGTLWSVGVNNAGQLGDGTIITRTIPVQITTGVSQVAAGSEFSLFVKTDGTLWAMGNNNYGQLGDGSTTQRNSPVPITTGVSAIAAGLHHSLLVKTNGSLWGMGRNDQGNLGDTTTTQRNSPVQIVASGVSNAIAAGGSHSLFVKTNGSLWGMGATNAGQLGLGSTSANQQSPVQLVTSGVSRVAAGYQHSAFIKTDKTLWTMGANGVGQLGDGTTTMRTTPLQVDLNVSDVAAGYRNTSVVISFP